MKNKYIEEYAKLRETVEFYDYNSKNSALDVAIYGAFKQSSWLENRKLYGSCALDTAFLDELLFLYYHCDKSKVKDFVSLVVNPEGACYLIRVNECNLDISNRLCPFLEIIHITCEEELLNAYDIFKLTKELPNFYKEVIGRKEVAVTNFKLPYKHNDTHYLLRDFLYVNLELGEVKSCGNTSYDMRNVDKIHEDVYVRSINKLKGR